jgi:hypothetical protein
MMTTKLRTGSFFPALLERRRCVDQCLFAVVMEAYLHGTSTREVDDLVKALVADLGGRDVGVAVVGRADRHTSAAGRLVLHVFGALAEFERWASSSVR